VPLGQATYFHRALCRFGAEHEFVVYPREGHGVAERNHQLDLLDRTRAWFARWLGDPAAGLDAPGENVARGGDRPAEQDGEVLAEP
jgi:hypothetical protein